MRSVEIVLAVLPPAPRASAVGLAGMEKSFPGGGGWTVSVTAVEWVVLGAVPLTVSVYVPGAAVPALTLSVEEPPATTDVGLRLAVAPDGTPETLRLIDSADPLTSAVEMVLAPLPPAARVSAAGFAEMEKSFTGGGGWTVSVTVVE